MRVAATANASGGHAGHLFQSFGVVRVPRDPCGRRRVIIPMIVDIKKSAEDYDFFGAADATDKSAASGRTRKRRFGTAGCLRANAIMGATISSGITLRRSSWW